MLFSSLWGRTETFYCRQKPKKGVEDRAGAPQAHRYSRAAACERTRQTRVIPVAVQRPWTVAESAEGFWALFVESTETTYRRSRAAQLAELR